MRNKGFFACAVISKRVYWTSVVPGKEMEDHSGDMDLGETYFIQGTVDDVV